jgi:hypothetical protein
MGPADAIAETGRDVRYLAEHYDVPAERLIRLLRAKHPQSLHAYMLLCSDPYALQPWTRLEDSVRTGRAAFDDVFGVSAFAYLADHPDLSAVFNTAISEGTRQSTATLLDHYDFSGFRCVTDVGGGDGTLLAAILGRNPGLTGVVFDTAAGVAQAAETLERNGVSNRCTIASGDFFDTVPAGADAYLIKSVLHNWDDERAAIILRNCRDAMAIGGRVLIMDPVIPEVVGVSDNDENPYLIDLNMLVVCGGKERTRADFEHLCTQARLSVVDIHELPSGVGFGLIEAVRVG